MQKPSIGRIVHYQSYGAPGGEFLPEPRAAIVTAVHPNDPGTSGKFNAAATIDAAVLNPTGLFFAVGLPFSETPEPGHWSWPPRVEG
jgi:hypothetical protein